MRIDFWRVSPISRAHERAAGGAAMVEKLKCDSGFRKHERSDESCHGQK